MSSRVYRGESPATVGIPVSEEIYSFCKEHSACLVARRVSACHLDSVCEQNARHERAFDGLLPVSTQKQFDRSSSILSDDCNAAASRGRAMLATRNLSAMRAAINGFRLGVQMKPEESLAEQYLNSLGYGTAEYEPDGNVPPDFLLRPSIAVEVRRLNKQVDLSGTKEGIEQAEIPLAKSVEKTLRKLDPLFSGKTYFVFYRFNRPISSHKKLSAKLEAALKTFLQGPASTPARVKIDPCLDIEIISATPRPGQCFIVAGNSDRERGGWLVADLAVNIQHCSDEKTVKIAPYRARYSAWWLLLVDFIGHGLDEFDQRQLKEAAGIRHTWDKIIIINPLQPLQAFEV
jgi:hypothetical protein